MDVDEYRDHESDYDALNDRLDDAADRYDEESSERKVWDRRQEEDSCSTSC